MASTPYQDASSSALDGAEGYGRCAERARPGALLANGSLDEGEPLCGAAAPCDKVEGRGVGVWVDTQFVEEKADEKYSGVGRQVGR